MDNKNWDEYPVCVEFSRWTAVNEEWIDDYVKEGMTREEAIVRLAREELDNLLNDRLLSASDFQVHILDKMFYIGGQ